MQINSEGDLEPAEGLYVHSNVTRYQQYAAGVELHRKHLQQFCVCTDSFAANCKPDLNLNNNSQELSNAFTEQYYKHYCCFSSYIVSTCRTQRNWPSGAVASCPNW